MKKISSKIDDELIDSVNRHVNKKMETTQLEAKLILEKAKETLTVELEAKRKNIEEIVFEKIKAQKAEKAPIKEKIILLFNATLDKLHIKNK